MSGMKHRILEIHSTYAWDFTMVRRAMIFAEAQGMTGIALHRNDFVDKLVYPSALVGGKRDYETAAESYNDVYANMYRNDPLSRDLTSRYGVYFRLVLNEAEKRGLQVFIENKEISFPDYIELLHPEVRKDGALCPCSPFFIGYLREKYTELFRMYPEIAGIITSLSTSESRTSFAVNHCTCDVCRDKDAGEWYREIVGAMYGPISAAGSRLVIRDFVFDAAAQEKVAAALDSMPGDISFSLKNTPHDYYPAFPHNPRIGGTPGHAQWIEYDVFGQYYGLGVGVAVTTTDIRERLAHARDNGVEGVLVRTCWEGLYGVSVFDTPNMVNLFSIAALSKDEDAETGSFYDGWLKYRGFYHPDATRQERREALGSVRDILERTWEVTRGAAYMNGCVFNDSTYYPTGMEQGFWLGEVKNSLRDWDASKWDAMSAIDPENVRAVMGEKDGALALVNRLCEETENLEAGLTGEAVAYLKSFMEAFRLYVQAYNYVGKGAILTRFFVTANTAAHPAFTREAAGILTACLEGLAQMEETFEHLWTQTSHHYFQAYLVLDPEKMRCLRRDFLSRLEGTSYRGGSMQVQKQEKGR